MKRGALLKKYHFINKKGYTLQEMLLAVAVIIIILAIAFPAIAAIRKNLQINELDDTARQIYLVVQNKLTTMKATGSLEKFNETLEKDYSAQKLSEIGLSPQDYDLGDDAWKQLYALNDTDEIMIESIIGDDSVLVSSLENGKFIVELNPETGDVYGVFYSKKDFIYNDVDFNGLPTRQRPDRKKVMIGYYGGSSDLSAVSELPTEFLPMIDVVNKEDLYIKVSCSNLRKLIKTQSYIVATITITDESYVPGDETNHVWSVDLQGGEDFWLKNDNLSFNYLLDSVRGDKESFREITEYKLTPGDNLTITVSMSYSYNEATIVGSASTSVNSLFGSKDDDGNISVNAVRHLNNLRDSIYSYDRSMGTTVTQSSDIDFDADTWSSDSVIPGKSIENPFEATGFTPIVNADLFLQTTYNGNNNSIQNFKITGNDYVGLFGKLNNCIVTNTKLVDCEISGHSYVGTIVGQMNSGSISNSNVYLSTKDEYNRPLTDMVERQEKYKIQASGSDVGGLVGGTIGSVEISDSFAAIDVNGYSNVGGLIGYHNSGLVENCYASGTVTSTSTGSGGLIGYVKTANISNCYSTSNVTSPGYSGGIAGNSQSGSIYNSKSYGKIAKDDGTANTSTSGAIIGTGSTYLSGCKYLRQANYNSDYAVRSGTTACGYPDLKSPTNNSVSNAHPYSEELFDMAFPFTLLRDNDNNIIDHYGNWPAELKLQTSLVYYERYSTPNESGSYYGYYAETSLTSTDEDLDNGGLNNWKVDTLRDEVCVEDGYALMSIYSLTSFTYKLNDDLNSSATLQTVTIGDTPGTGKSVRIANGVTLQFNNITDGATYRITSAKVYQLPFELQMTDRNTASRFYDRLKISGYINADAKFEDYTFFYCPDFAKNAINPDISDTNARRPSDPTGEDKPIYVRSARQINALGRSAYYWNTSRWSTNLDTRFYFVQETDIDFGKYTTAYCGKSYNLMDASSSNPYRNRPIGRPNVQQFIDPNGNTYTPSNFRNSYDGQGNKIIDYRCITYQSDKYQFTGLFGEIQLATLKNIVMVASDPNNTSGYVESQYNDNNHHAGVGALVGLVYVDQGSEYSGTYSSVSNCVVSGYTVRYNSSNPYYPAAVGGLAGYNFGKIENCSAVSKLVTATTTSGTKARYIGGLVGSINSRGSITNCYAGGTIAASHQNGGSTYLGGICAGFDDIYGAYYTDGQKGNRNERITNCYSYCTWNSSNIVGTPYAVSPNSDKITVTNCYYLTSTVGTGVTLYGTNLVTAKDYSGLRSVNLLANGSAFASGKAASSKTYPWSDSLEGRAYPFPAVAKEFNSSAYIHYGDWYSEANPLPTGYLAYYEQYSDGTNYYNYMDKNGTITSIGTMDVTNAKIITSAGYGLLCLSDENTHSYTVNGTTLTLGSLLNSNITVGKGTYNLYALSSSSITALTPSSGVKSKSVTFGYDIVDYDTSTSAEVTVYINPYFGNAISASSLTATSVSPLQVRTPEQLQNMNYASSGWYIKQTHNITATTGTGNINNNGYNFNGGYTAGGSGALYGSYNVGNNGNYIIGLTHPLFISIGTGATIENVAIIDANVTMDTTSAAPLTVVNFGVIQNCFAEGSVTATGNGTYAAGLVASNAATITSSYANCIVASNFGSSAGFVLSNSGTINNCYSVGTVNSSNGSGAGFVISNTNSTGNAIQNCYTISKVSSNSGYGFAPKSSGIAGTCYWAKDTGYNSALSTSVSAGTSKTLSQMKTVFTSGSWTTNNTGHTWPKLSAGSYPYPRISTLDHCGDWSNSTVTGRIGVFRLYKRNWNYAAYGLDINLSNSNYETDYYVPWNYNPYGNKFGIMFDNEFAQNISDWTVTYTYHNGQRTSNIPLSSSSNISLNNTSGMITIMFDPTDSDVDSITFTNNYDSSQSYTFVWDWYYGHFYYDDWNY